MKVKKENRAFIDHCSGVKECCKALKYLFELSSTSGKNSPVCSLVLQSEGVVMCIFKQALLACYSVEY